MNENKVTLSGKPPHPEYSDSGAPQPVNLQTGMHRDYWVLSEDERAKGFVRPVRRSYRHVGVRPQYPVRDLVPYEIKRYAQHGYVKFEEYPPSDSNLLGRYWTEAQLKSGCQTVTTMSETIAETYARDPKFYGDTFCCGCGAHFPVGENGEFVWEDGARVGT